MFPTGILFFQRVQDAEWKQMIPLCEEASFSAGDVIVSASNGPTDKVYLVKTGEVVLVDSDALPGSALPGENKEVPRTP